MDETISYSSPPLTIGIGLDAGQAVPVDGGYRGGAPNVAAWLCSLAAPARCSRSREIVHLARRVEGARFTERGPAQLRVSTSRCTWSLCAQSLRTPPGAIARFVRSGPAIAPRRAPVELVAIVAAFVVIAAVIAVPAFA